MEDTANTEPESIELSADAQNDSEQNTPDTGSEESSLARVRETELLTRISTLEKAIEESRIARQPYQSQSQGVDQAQLHAAMDALVTDGDASIASQRLGEVLNEAGGNLTQDAVSQMKAYLEIERDLNEKAQSRTYMKDFRPLVEQQIAQYVNAGYDPKAATAAAIRDYDSKFSSYEQKLKPKQQSTSAPSGAQGMTGQAPFSPPPPRPVAETPESYVQSRQQSSWDRAAGVQRK